MNPRALFVRDGDGYLADPVCDGPWAEGALHGGAPAALLAHVLTTSVDDPTLRLARITCEFVRPTPRGPLTPRIEVVRPGRRLRLLDAALQGPDGVEVTRARALFLRPAELSATDVAPPPFAGPEAAEATDWVGDRPMFATDALEVRFAHGRFRAVGPATAWFRLRPPLIAGEPTFGVDRIVAAADFGNGIASELDWGAHTFINPDLSVSIERDPVDEWVALDARMEVHEGAVAVARSTLYDRRGRIGQATQSLLVGRAGTGST